MYALVFDDDSSSSEFIYKIIILKERYAIENVIFEVLNPRDSSLQEINKLIKL